jgi:hypothetical protein
MKRTVILAVDVESMGANLLSHHTTQLGAAVVDLETGLVLSTFNEYIKKDAVYTETGDIVHGFEPRCETEFWDKHPLKKAETLERIYHPDTLYDYQVVIKFVAWVRWICNDANVVVVTDTSGFDVARIDKMFPMYATAEHFPTSMNYLFLDKTGTKTRYNGIEQVSSLAKGIACALSVSKPPGLSNFELACMALGVPVPHFPVEHDHDPANDATVIAMRYAFLLKQSAVHASERKL